MKSPYLYLRVEREFIDNLRDVNEIQVTNCIEASLFYRSFIHMKFKTLDSNFNSTEIVIREGRYSFLSENKYLPSN